MANTVTDSLGLVSTSSVSGGRWFFPPKVGPDTGFSLQVFQPSGEYFGSVDENGPRITARDGDTVLRINLGLHTLSLNGALHTRDGHTRKYEADVIIQVVNAVRFATCYRQGTDPVGQARLALDADLVRWAERMSHDDISPPMMRFRLENGLNRIGSAIGLRVIAAERVIAYASDHHTAMLEIVRKRELTHEQLNSNAILEQATRDKAAKDHAAGREQVDLDEQLKLRVETRRTIILTLLKAHMDRLQQLIADDFTLDQINQKEPELQRVIARLSQLSVGEPAALLDGPTDGNDDLLASLLGTRDSTSLHTVEGGDTHYNDRFGIHLRPITLTEAQWDALDDRQMSVRQAFQIADLDSGGPSDKAQLYRGDIIVQINGQSLHDRDAISSLVDGAQANTTVSVNVLRGSEVSEVDVLIAR